MSSCVELRPACLALTPSNSTLSALIVASHRSMSFTNACNSRMISLCSAAILCSSFNSFDVAISLEKLNHAGLLSRCLVHFCGSQTLPSREVIRCPLAASAQPLQHIRIGDCFGQLANTDAHGLKRRFPLQFYLRLLRIPRHMIRHDQPWMASQWGIDCWRLLLKNIQGRGSDLSRFERLQQRRPSDDRPSR